MKRFFIIIMIIFMFNAAAIPEDTIYNDDIVISTDFKKIERDFNNLLESIGYTIDSKSLKGWIRIFNSKEKLYDYEIYIPEADRKLYIIFLKNKLKKEENKYNRGLK